MILVCSEKAHLHDYFGLNVVRLNEFDNRIIEMDRITDLFDLSAMKRYFRVIRRESVLRRIILVSTDNIYLVCKFVPILRPVLKYEEKFAV